MFGDKNGMKLFRLTLWMLRHREHKPLRGFSWQFEKIADHYSVFFCKTVSSIGTGPIFYYLTILAELRVLMVRIIP